MRKFNYHIDFNILNMDFRFLYGQCWGHRNPDLFHHPEV